MCTKIFVSNFFHSHIQSNMTIPSYNFTNVVFLAFKKLPVDTNFSFSFMLLNKYAAMFSKFTCY